MTTHSVSEIRVPAKRELTVLKMSEANLTVGSMILTASGEQSIEDLKPGDLVVTKNLGLQKLRYIAFQDVDLATNPSMSPIRMNCTHLGSGRVSYFAPNQKISVRHPMFEMMFGASEVLLRCGDVIDQPGFEQMTELTSLTYVALGFARRHVLSCNGASIEVGPSNLKPSRMCLGPEEARLALQLLEPRQSQAKRHSFPLH